MNSITNINEYGKLAEWDTTSRKYHRKIKRLARRRKLFPNYYLLTQSYQLGFTTWEHSRAEIGIKSDHNDPRWGRYFVPHLEYKEFINE